MLKKRGVIEFSWIFALIVGAVVLFLAFYFIGNKFIERDVVSSTQAEHSLDIILNPFSSFGGLGATSSKVIELSKAEQISFSCFDNDIGYDSISVTTDSSFGPERKIYDKYIFSENFTIEKNFQIISKPFSMPWRVADLIYFIPKNTTYCFVKSSSINNIEDEFGEKETAMNISNFKFVNNEGECSEISGDVVTVCSGYSGCDVNIEYGLGKITKTSGTFYFSDDSLMYAAIFSDLGIYNCNLKRLAKRIEYQSDVYTAKSSALAGRCQTNFNLGALKAAAGQLADAEQRDIGIKLEYLRMSAELIGSQNYGASCHLY